MYNDNFEQIIYNKKPKHAAERMHQLSHAYIVIINCLKILMHLNGYIHHVP